MDKEQEIQLIKKAQQGDIEAENSVALAYMNLAKSIARSFGIAGAYDVDDLAGYGMLGLIRAIHTYDENGKARVLHDHKLEALEDLIEAANGQSVLVAYWFKHDRERIINHLTKLKIPVRDIKTSDDIKDWNAGKIPVALIHPASAGHGLNIQQGGHILIWFGLTWSLELYQQTNARLWRQGQTQVVTIHHIITKNTVDEDVMAALEQKDMTQEKLISAVKARLEE